MKILLFGGTGGMGSLTSEILTKRGYECVALGSNEANITQMIEIKQALNEHQPDVVLNFAVYNVDAVAHKLDEAEVEKQLDVNVKGALNVLNASINHFRNHPKGRIVFLSSVLSSNPVIGTSVYSASKGFVDNLVKTAALENAKHGITVNSIQLGYFEAGLIKKVPTDLLDAIVSKIPLKRLGKGEELVNAIEFLINTEYVTGVNLPLTGGLNISAL